MHDTGQCFPLYLYEKDEPQEGELISYVPEGELVDGYRRRSAITDAILADFRAAYETPTAPSNCRSRREKALTSSERNNLSLLTSSPTGRSITKEDIFYYVYGVLHSPEYRARFASDLKKMLPPLHAGDGGFMAVQPGRP
jgi:predicted helicase